MSIQTTALKYGWYIVAGAVLTGATIFVTDSTQKRITQRDAIQVILGTVERCYATQTATNPTYSVSPPSFVRSWVSTNGAGGWETNQVTNSISWYTDRAMMVSLDATIKALCPYYVDTNSVYDGTTNIVMLTVTGLWASLNIGDGTNKFTAIPGWTNAATTNYSGTNAISTNAATTNIVSYGPWAWRNYVVAWQERYKVLEALKVVRLGLCVGTNFPYSGATISGTWYSPQYPFGFYQGASLLGTNQGVSYPISMGANQYDYQNPYSSLTAGNATGLNNYPCWFKAAYYYGTNAFVSFEFNLDTPEHTEIWNVIRQDILGGGEDNLYYDASSFSINRPFIYQNDSIYYILATITPDFLYCTNKFW